MSVSPPPPPPPPPPPHAGCLHLGLLAGRLVLLGVEATGWVFSLFAQPFLWRFSEPSGSDSCLLGPVNGVGGAPARSRTGKMRVRMTAYVGACVRAR
eukprot:3683992-Alexandrium_andersonii.AAC.1